MTQAIDPQAINQFQADLQKLPAAPALQNSVAHNGIFKSSLTLKSQAAMSPTFSIELDTGKVADQQRSGMCWIFAALNTLRHPMQNKFKLKDFELSESYMFFWDKLEKSNYFYENIIKTAALPLGDRKVDFLLATPQQDGGQWDLVCALFDKYGVVPKSVMPDTANRTNSADLNKVLNLKLRKDAIQLRQLVKDQAPETQVQSHKEQMLSEVYRILVLALGQPPVKFDWSYRDDDQVYHTEHDLTPLTFYKKYIGMDLSQYISTINSPTADKPYNEVYTVEMLGNVVGGRQVRHLNLDLKTFKEAAIQQLKNGEAVWFGSDVSQMAERQSGILDTDIYDLQSLFNIDFNLTKAQRLDYAESLMNHAMVLTGVDLDDQGKPRKWKVENSWGEKVGTKGYFVMSDAWFDQFVYQLVINKQYLSDELNQIYDQASAHVLAPWDPMGSLA